MLIKCIAIDFDNTFTADEILWRNFIYMTQNRGYTVICATSRTWSECNEQDLSKATGVKVVFCGTRYKRDACIEAGYDVKIWIDDNPQSIVDVKPWDTLKRQLILFVWRWINRIRNWRR